MCLSVKREEWFVMSSKSEVLGGAEMGALREYLCRRSEKGTVVIIPSCALEDVAVLMFRYRKRSEAVWVQKVRGYEAGFVFNLLSGRAAFCEVLGCDEHEIWPTYIKCCENPIKPVLNSEGSVQEVVYIGSEVDLGRLPVVKYNARDAGPYITAGIVIAKDPETGTRNVSIHRLQVRGARELGIRLEPGCHLEMIRNKARELRTGVEVAIVVGNHPAEIIAAVTRTEFGVDEVEIAGAIRGEPVQLVKCRTIDAEVPANAEVVLEGYMDPEERALEGPFGDFMGYYVAQAENPVIHVTAITHRDKPIFQGIRAGSLEDGLLLALSREARIYKALKNAGIDVARVNLSPTVFVGAISIRAKDSGEVRRALEIALDEEPWLKYCVAVDTDVNIFDWEDVLWAVATRSSPSRVKVFEGKGGFPRDPFNLHKSKLIIDATIPIGACVAFERSRPDNA